MDWIKIVERKQCALNLNWVCSGQTEYWTKKLLGYDLGYDDYLYLDGLVYVGSGAEKSFAKKFGVAIDDGSGGLKNLKKFYDIWKKQGNKLVEEAENTQLAKNTPQAIAEALKQVTDSFYTLSTSLTIVVPIEKFLEKEIRQILVTKGRTDIDKDLYLLTISDSKNENDEETEELESIVNLFRSAQLISPTTNIEIDQRIEAHRRKYGWLNNARYLDDAWTKEELLSRIYDKMNASGVKKTEDHKEERDELTKELFSAEKELALINLARNFVFYRTFRMNCFMKAAFLTRPLLLKITDHLKINFVDLTYMTPSEIYNSLTSNEKVPSELIAERRKYFGYHIHNNVVRTFSGQEFDKFKSENFQDSVQNQIKTFNGVVAYKGIVIGTAKIVRGVSDLKKVEKGDILVSPMTLPNFIPAMERAAAFVTDEGGILCHAAIVSREMKKPCIIGTKIATQMLKDGDMIEVDADNGVVKILK